MRRLFFQMALVPSLVMGLPEIRWVELLNSKNNNDAAVTTRNKDDSSRVRGAGKRKTIRKDLGDVQELYMQQSLDHFRLQDDRTFSQRYFYTDRFAAAASHNCSKDKQQQHQQQQQQREEFTFLCVGGEGPALDKSVLVDSVHCTGDMIELAKILYTQHNASVHLYALEHRYYGKSYPTFFNDTNNDSSSSPVSNENLVYLSSRQALADLSNFVSTVNAAAAAQHHGCCQKAMRWVTFGGSYPGMLAAWARLQFPHLIHAAVSNSAPIQAQLDFPEYSIHAGWTLSYEKVGGSQECLDIVKKGHEELAKKVLDPTLHFQIAKDFNLCNATSLANPKNVQLFLGDGVYDPNAQENDPSCGSSRDGSSSPYCNIAKKCQALINAKTKRGLTPYETLRWIVQQDQASSDCTVLDWQGTLDYMANPELIGEKRGLRSWIWQTCTEFGFYQTCELNSDCPYGRGWHNVSKDLEICEYAFGVQSSRVIQAVQETLNYYGGWNLKATRVLSVNGNVDPWSELALVPGRGEKRPNKSSARRREDEDDDDDDRPTWMVPGASHHFWTHAVKETDTDEVVQARQVIYQTVLGWLRVEDSTNNVRDDHLLRGRNTSPATSQNSTISVIM